MSDAAALSKWFGQPREPLALLWLLDPSARTVEEPRVRERAAASVFAEEIAANAWKRRSLAKDRGTGARSLPPIRHSSHLRFPELGAQMNLGGKQ